jgi:anti-anti-sigma factor
VQWNDDDTVVLKVEGHFGFPLYRQFREAAARGGSSKRYVIDLRAANYMDSSALGMLLLLRDQVGGKEARIEITQCQPDVRKIFAIANFDRMFRIS